MCIERKVPFETYYGGPSSYVTPFPAIQQLKKVK